MTGGLGLDVGMSEALVLAAAIAAVVFALVVGIRIGLWVGRASAERRLAARLGRERSDAVRRSRAVLGGQLSEQLAPYLPGFPGDPTEVRFVGKPVDFVSFAGASEGSVREVVFIEVKSGDAALTAVERSLRKAIEEGRVRYVEYRVPR